VKSLLTVGRYDEAYTNAADGLENYSADTALRLLARETALFKNNPAEANRRLDEIKILLEQRPPEYHDGAELVALGQALLLLGVEPRLVLENCFQRAEKLDSPPREAFLFASRQVEQFYKEAGRLATEHALLDDNGDGLGTPADWFRGVRAVKTAASGKSVDGVRAHQFHFVRSDAEQKLSPAARARRDELEKQLGELRARKDSLNEEEYYRQLENLLREIAGIYRGD
jgi:hypothetical protein